MNSHKSKNFKSYEFKLEKFNSIISNSNDEIDEKYFYKKKKRDITKMRDNARKQKRLY